MNTLGFEHYAFAFFIFLLVCGALYIASKLLSNTKQLRELLEEKETKLLLLYQTIEETMDQHNQDIEMARKQTLKLQQQVNTLLNQAFDELNSVSQSSDINFNSQQNTGIKGENLIGTEIKSVNNKKSANKYASNQTQQKTDETMLNQNDFQIAMTKSKQQSNISAASKKTSKTEKKELTANNNEKVVKLAKQQKTPQQIAEILQITKSEVDLILQVNNSLI